MKTIQTRLNLAKALNLRKVSIGFLTLTLVLLLSATRLALAQGPDYTLDWWTVDGGGHTFSTGDGHTLGGTIGQPDAGVMEGEPYALHGGFWPGCSVGQYTVYLPLVLR